MPFKKIGTLVSFGIIIMAVTGATASENNNDKNLTQRKTCEIISANYAKVLLGTPLIGKSNGQIHDDLVRVSATIARHNTLQRLLTMSWSLQCDVTPLLAIENKRIDSTYKMLGVD